ncbi:unnamed protein product [Musa acuminata subsp. malaccensis]|uniref:(wild Malaysian banana) hypothetical protein n=1 Tax=Musa acuminata subsp. malaccensis TaxID=214687 RepID=A0A804IAB2_MUSAM|nr:unnamed protein product [Musa acuminata subsp. malaccensis]
MYLIRKKFLLKMISILIKKTFSCTDYVVDFKGLSKRLEQLSMTPLTSVICMYMSLPNQLEYKPAMMEFFSSRKATPSLWKKACAASIDAIFVVIRWV